MITSHQVAKLETQFTRGLISAAEFAAELMHIATMKAKALTTTYSVTLLVDGHRAGGQKEATLEEVTALSECGCCEPYLDVTAPECEFGCVSLQFAEDLKASGQAMIVTRTMEGVSVLVVHVNK